MDAFVENSKVSGPSPRELATWVALDVNRTLGGGYASMELLRRRFTAHGWLDAASHGLLLAVSRLTPGTNILAYCTALGWRFQRLAGALSALTAASLPAAVIVYALAAALVRVDRYPTVQLLLAVGICVASILVLSSAWTLIRPYLGKPFRTKAVVIILVAAVVTVLGATPVRALLITAALGYLLPPTETRR